MDNQIRKEPGFWDNPVTLFFLGPIVFLIVVRFTGFQIFYGNATATDQNNSKGRAIKLVSLGSLFYLVMIILLASI